MQDDGSAFSFQPHQPILGLLGPFGHEHAIAGLLGTNQPFLDRGCDSPQQLHMQPPNPQALLFFNQPSRPFTGRLGDLFAFCSSAVALCNIEFPSLRNFLLCANCLLYGA